MTAVGEDEWKKNEFCVFVLCGLIYGTWMSLNALTMDIWILLIKKNTLGEE